MHRVGKGKVFLLTATSLNVQRDLERQAITHNKINYYTLYIIGIMNVFINCYELLLIIY